MARNRSRGTLVDYLVAAIEPALIMVMVGSLMFFLLDLWYSGEYVERLRWILFWFVLGIVLITRVSMRIGSSLAKAYGWRWAARWRWWPRLWQGFNRSSSSFWALSGGSTHKLTFDCTLLDEDQDAGVGLLQESGLDTSDLEQPTSPSAIEDPSAMDASLLTQKSRSMKEAQGSDEARRPNAPGVWLIYFTLASLPLFGLGQWLVPAVEEDRRMGLFVYFLAYISSGMGLLLATSFLNLRRYLRQRKLKMPAAMTATWLSTGAVVIVGLTVLAAALPLPGTGWSVVRGSTQGTSNLRASRLRDAQGRRREGRRGGRPEERSRRKTGNLRKGKGRRQERPGQRQDRHPRGKSSPSKDGATGKKGSSKQDQSGDRKGQNERSDDKSDRANDDNKKAGPDDQKNSEPNDDKSSRENENPNDAANPPPKLPSVPFQAPSWLNGLLKVVGAVALIYGLIRYGPVLLDAIRELIAALLGGFGSRKQKKRGDQGEAAASEPVSRPRPFASFADPFASGLAQNFSPNDLVIYSFEALEAWAYEQNLARSPHETPSRICRPAGTGPGRPAPGCRAIGRLFRDDRLWRKRVQS